MKGPRKGRAERPTRRPTGAIDRGALSPMELDMIANSMRELLAKASPHDRVVALLGGDGEPISLPPALLRHFITLVDRLTEADAVHLVLAERELSPQEAASILNVSRQYVTRLLDDGAIPSRQMRKGGHRKILERDVLAYKARRDAKRRRTLDDLVAFGEKIGGYEVEHAPVQR